jgi:hypothetical protein
MTTGGCVKKGHKREMFFLLIRSSLGMRFTVGSYFFFVWTKICRERLDFMSTGVYSICGKILLAYSLSTFIFFRVFSVHAKVLYFWRIRRQLSMYKNNLKSPTPKRLLAHSMNE